MQLFEYIVQHYVLILGIAIVIILAIIGYYADKTNFGQGKHNVEDDKLDSNKDIDEVSNNSIDDAKPQTLEESSMFNDIQDEEKGNEDIDNTNKEILNNENSSIVENSSKDDAKMQNFDLPIKDIAENIGKTSGLVDENLIINDSIDQDEKSLGSLENMSKENMDSFDEEFDMVLPKKDLIDSDLLSDIEEMELDKTKKLDLSDLSDLSDIELPKIKNLAQEDQDIWKF